ncbi:ABC transporter permease [Nitriliruptoria bacterium AS10]|nr:ABC transporter permease [Salsipaludibacter albus]
MVGSGATARSRPSLPTMLALEVRDEMRMIRREPATLFFSIVMPVAFFALFVGMFGAETTGDGLPAGTVMLATFGAYGAIAATMSTPGIGLATIRENGWLEAVKVSPVPVGVSLAAKVIATVPYVVGILGAMTVTSAAMGVLDITLGQWLLLVVALIVGCQVFALLGLAVGAIASPNATTAILNAILLPLAIAGGLWFPLESLPDFVATIAPWLPTYHLAKLAAAPLGGGPWLGHLVVLVVATGIAGLVARWTWTRSHR